MSLHADYILKYRSYSQSLGLINNNNKNESNKNQLFNIMFDCTKILYMAIFFSDSLYSTFKTMKQVAYSSFITIL